MPGNLIVMSAPSGAGKSSLVKALLERVENLAVSVSNTTRAPREGEVDGKDYHFTAKADFEAMVAQGDFLEHAQVFDNFYGTSQSNVEAQLAAGQDVILEIDWQGARQVRERMSCFGLFVLPPSKVELDRRLRGRGTDSDEIIARRMRDAESEMSHYDEYEYVVVNDDFDTAVAQLETIIRAQRLSRAALGDRLTTLADELLAK